MYVANEFLAKMNSQIATLDWVVIVGYLLGLIAFSAFLGLRQSSRGDYYVADHKMGAVPIAISVMATQCSTNSILGAPAFVAFAVGGGLGWLQYELAVPLAMIVVMTFFLPLFQRLRVISIYEYLERRFDLKTRLLLSGLFQVIRAFATAVTVYGIATVIVLITDLSFFYSVVLLGVVTVLYDVLGGIRAVVYSDVIQMFVLVSVLIFLVVLLSSEAGGPIALLSEFDPQRTQALNFQKHGLGDGEDFAFWPMLIGGFFLYVSYYGCDQSQVQRMLCAKSVAQGRMALVINGLLRFPVVLLYCFLGVGIGVYAATNTEFIGLLPLNGDKPNFNLAVPLYMLEQLPVGAVGLALVALFAAAMSSLDSVINSLSATTMDDFVRRFCGNGGWSDATELFFSRILTVVWGAVILTLSFFVADIASTILVAINKIGSLINGPVLAVFFLGIFSTRTTGTGACTGLLLGFILNLSLWQFAPSISWLWWNVFGFIATCVSAFLISHLAAKMRLDPAPPPQAGVNGNVGVAYLSLGWASAALSLIAWFVMLLALLLLF